MSFEIFGYISAMCFFLGYIPQLVRTYRLQTVDDISVWMWLLTLMAYISGGAYGIWLGKWPLIISYALGLYCTIMMLMMYYLYRDPRKDKIRTIVRGFLRDSKRRFKND
jgi:uncharacterized protein with PQ loop repeat